MKTLTDSLNEQQVNEASNAIEKELHIERGNAYMRKYKDGTYMVVGFGPKPKPVRLTLENLKVLRDLIDAELK